MDLYTLNENFLADEMVEGYISAIWTERYSTAGDFQIVCPPTAENIAKLAEGKFLGRRGTKEVMQIETASIEDGKLTVVGPTLTKFLNQRLLWVKNPDSADASERVADLSDATPTRTPGEFISAMVYNMAIAPVEFTLTAWDDANLNWADEAIENLTLGDIDASGPDERLTAPLGPLYDAIVYVSVPFGVGISLYLDEADPDTGYSLKFKTYRGLDRTSTQDDNPLVRLSPNMETLNNLKEIHSIQEFKNVCYVYYQGEISVHYAPGVVDIPENFNRRVMITDAEGQPVGHKVTAGAYGGFPGYSYIATSPGDIATFREQNAQDAFANHNYIRAIDGETSPMSDYKFGVDYNLGDIIELEGIGGTLSRARVTEYIVSQDVVGEREYPTISVVD